MGRYLAGTAGFSYKYVFGRQPANVRRLAGVSGVGDGGIAPVLSALLDPEGYERFALFELLREQAERSGQVFRGVPSGDLWRRDGEFLCYLVGELAIPIAVALDARLSVPVDRVLAACGAYGLDRADQPALLDWIRGYAPGLDLDRDAVRDPERVAAGVKALGDREDHLPAMALWILRHAVVHDLDRIEVREQEPEISLGPEDRPSDLWKTVRSEWGPGALSSPELPDDPDALLARGAICHWAGRTADADAAFRLGHERGDPRAARWLAVLCGRAWTPDDRLALGPLAAAKLDRASMRGPISSRVWALGLTAEALVAEAARADGPVREALLDLVPGVTLWRSTDPDALASAFEAARDRGWLEPESSVAGKALTHLLDEDGDPARLARALDAASDAIRSHERLRGGLAYDVARAASRLGRKEEMLGWLRIARVGDHWGGAAEDPDFDAWVGDPDFRAVVAP